MTDGPRHGQSATGPAARAADPNTPQVQLQMLASDHPELRPQIAENPNTYPELLHWLGELGDPAVDAALARRAAGTEFTEEFSAVRTDRPQSYDPGYSQDYDQSYERGYDSFDDQDPATSQPRSGYYPAAPAGPAPWETQAAPASYMDPEPEPRRRRGGGTCAIIFLILLVAAAAVVAAYFLIFNGVFTSEEEPTGETSISEEATDQGQDTEEDDTTAPEESTQEESPEAQDQAEAVRPAPEGAQDIPAFTAPSGNINCTIGEDELECNILEYNFEAPQDCDGPARLSVGAEDPALDCGSAEGANSATLQYGQSASNGRFACTSSEAAFECWNTETGNGFTLSRENYQLQN